MSDPATDDNTGPADKSYRRQAVRIDTLQNRLAATRALLETVEEELVDLHVLAYERQVLSQERVHGGQPDYALDNHGIRPARDAYRQLGDTTIDIAERLSIAAHDTIKVLREGTKTGLRPRRMIRAEELAQAIAARARRLARGEYTPIRREPQPKPGT